ncbi:enoyl-CoA hydratase [Dactylosporangium sp. NPDC005572]|uniref:enoyl-CoA hydratase/isomerase family protein n=1 Tax=Dactylosporangium sp. NPDC005572 TaxID=3156889 RepID=UPI0033A9C1D3
MHNWSAQGLRFESAHHVAWLRLDRPDRRNAIDKPLRQALIDAIAEVRADPDIRVGVITGTGTAFSAGADILGQDPIEIEPAHRRGRLSNVAYEDALRYGWWRLTNALWDNEKPFIAAVNGPAVGGGCSLALACDLVVAAESAWFQEIFVNRGLPLEGGAAYLLPRAIGLPRAKEIAMFGDRVEAREAADWGLVNRVVPDAELEAFVSEWALRLANRPSIALGHIKRQLNFGLESSLGQVFREEAVLLGIGGGDDQTEAMQAFVERRPPHYTGK